MRTTNGSLIIPVSRRALLRTGAAALGTAAVSGFTNLADAGGYLFTLGVASGDPDDCSVTLWTRLAPDPLGNGGMGPDPVKVTWRIATDERMRHVVRSGVVFARPELGHSVHVRARGLDSDRWYYYQFVAKGQRSALGRTRTFPAAFDRAPRMRFALASCQDYQAGFFSAYRHMAEQDLDFVVHVGDYIYEYGPNPAGVRQVPDEEIQTLDDYRRRYALYRLDPDLQAAHAAFPFLVSFDDHEVDNNYAGSIPEDDQAPDVFLARRTAAYQAYFENMPLAFRSFPHGTHLRLFRKLSFGNLANIHMLDTRQFRTDQPCGDGLKPICEDVFDPEASLTGDTQETWLLRKLARSRARWNVLAQQVMMTHWDLGAAVGSPVPFFNVDAWDGYPAARNRILSFLDERKIANPIVLSGDIHSSWQANLKLDFTDPESPTIATEFVGTSISSEFPPEYIPLVEATLPFNPHINYFDGLHRGYMQHEVTRDHWRAEYYGVRDPWDPTSEVDFLAAFAVAAGEPGAVID